MYVNPLDTFVEMRRGELVSVLELVRRLEAVEAAVFRKVAWVVDYCCESMDWHATTIAVCADRRAAIAKVTGLLESRGDITHPTIETDGEVRWKAGQHGEYVAREVEVIQCQTNQSDYALSAGR